MVKLFLLRHHRKKGIWEARKRAEEPQGWGPGKPWDGVVVDLVELGGRGEESKKKSA